MDKSKFRWKSFFFFTLIVSFFLLTISSLIVYFNRDSIKKSILSSLTNPNDILLTYKSEVIHIFPYPGLRLTEVSLKDKNDKNKFDVHLEEIDISVNWRSLLLKNIKVKKFTLHKGEIEIFINKNSKNKDEYLKPQKENILNSIKSFQMQGIELIALAIKLRDSNKNLLDQMYVKKLNYDIYNNKHFLEFIINHRQGSVNAKIEVELPDFNFESKLFLDGFLELKNFSPRSFKNYYSFFKLQDFDNTLINGVIQFHKEKNNARIIFENNLRFLNLNFKSLPPCPELIIKSSLSFNLKENVLGFDDVNVIYGDYLIAHTSGYLKFNQKKIHLFLDIQGEKVELLNSLQFIISFVILDIKPGGNDPVFTGELRIVSKHASFEDYEFKDPKVDLYINNQKLKLDIKEAGLLFGHLKGEGNIYLSKKVVYKFDVNLDSIDLSELISKHTDEEFIDGNISGKINFESNGDNDKEFFDNLKLKSELKVTNGQLLGYANFFRPVLALGKLINIQGPKGKSTEFKSLDVQINVENRIIEIEKLKMLGVGIDAKGKGKIDFDYHIDFRLTVGLGGIAGKALSIPIIYSGIIPHNAAYIDPVWLGSVYVGATFLGGPVGATAGGVAGSAVSGYIRSFYDKITGFFKNDKEKEKE